MSWSLLVSDYTCKLFTVVIDGVRNAMQISDAEWTVMTLVWDSQPVDARFVIDELSGPNKWSAATIKTMLHRLVKKGALHHEAEVVQEHALSLVALGILPTIIGPGLLVESFKYFSVSKASILTSFQVLVAIVLAMVFLHEFPKSNVWIGGAIITAAVLYEIMRKVKKAENS